jgi:transposase
MTTQAYGVQLRERIVAARQDGHSAQEVAKWFKVSKRSVERFWTSYQQTGSVKPKQRGGYRHSRMEAHTDTLREWIAQQPDLTLHELQQRVSEMLNVQIGITALWQQLDKLGLSFKKNAARQRARS